MSQPAVERAMKSRVYLTPADHDRPLSLEEFESADSQEGFRYELIRGRLDVSPIPDLSHERLIKWLGRLLEDYARQHPEVFNEVFGPARVFVPHLEEGVTAPEPDLACYRDFPSDLPLREVNWQDVSPLVVVEVISPDNVDKDLTRNVSLYLQVPSVREYWIVDPRQSHERPSLLVYRRRGQRWQKPIRAKEGDTYTTRLLPGFALVLDRHA